MIFFVYLEPEVFAAAAAENDKYALPVLQNILRDWLHCCVLLDFDDYRWRAAIKNSLGTNASKIKRILSEFKKRNRIVPYFQDDYLGRSDNSIVAEQSESARLDCILCTEPDDFSGAKPEPVTLRTYDSNPFSEQVKKPARVFADGELDCATFLDINFRNLFRFARRIDVWDKLLGEKFGNNFAFSLTKLVLLANKIIDKPEEEPPCEFVIHCRNPKKRREHFEEKINSLRKEVEPGSKIHLCVEFYEHMPHDRFILTDQHFALSLGRGIDFLNPRTKRNRDTTLALLEYAELHKKLNAKT